MSVYVLGGDGDALGKAFARLPPVRVAGLDPSVVTLDEDQPDIVARINAARPDLLFVALGNPKQELWMGRNAAKVDVPVIPRRTFSAVLRGRRCRVRAWRGAVALEGLVVVVAEVVDADNIPTAAQELPRRVKTDKSGMACD